MALRGPGRRGAVLIGVCDAPEQLVVALGARPVIAHDAKALGLVPETLVHDTEIAAYLLEPARRAYPFRELTEERGFAAPPDREPAAADAVLVRQLADWQREELRGRGLTDLMTDVELPLVRILRDMELAGLKLDTERLAAISTRGQGGGRRARAARSSSWRGRSSRSAHHNSSRRSCSASSGSRASGAARPATAPTRACCRRSATSTRSSPRSSAGAS